MVQIYAKNIKNHNRIIENFGNVIQMYYICTTKT